MPAIALVAGISLLTGQTFNCCRFNESITGKIVAALSHLSSSEHSGAARSHEEIESHAHCHGHEAKEETSSLTGQLYDGSVSGYLVENATCLSERVESGKPMLAGDFSFSPTSDFLVASIVSWIPTITLLPLSPRPQNKSSPPLYLTILRILV